MTSPSSVDVVRRRRRRLHTFSRAYDSAASQYNDRARTLGVVTATLSALVSSAIFTSLNADAVESYWKWITGGVSLLATIAAAAAAALSYADKASAFRKAAVKCVELKNRAEELIASGQVSPEELAEFDKLVSEAEGAMAIVPEPNYRRAEDYGTTHPDSLFE